jgi:predicted metal-dependent hydrolase
MTNRCIDCFKEIRHKGARCKSCHIKNIRKPESELSNIDISNRYQELRTNIKKSVEDLIKFMSREIDKFYELKQKFKLNEDNSDLLDKDISKIIDFKEKLIETWHKTMKTNGEQSAEEFLRKIKIDKPHKSLKNKKDF